MTYRFLIISSVAATLMGCATWGADPVATAELQPASGSSVKGTVHFEQHKHGMVKVSGKIRGLAPESEHGFHIHEKGDCSSADGSSAGGHFNPGNAGHGKHGRGTRHAGDLPNLRANAEGVATLEYETDQISLNGDANITELAVVVHADPDDFTSQPAGNAGTRLACGVVKLQ